MTRAGLGALDLLDEAISSLLQRKLRSALTSFASALGVAVLIAVVGISHVASVQIDEKFTELAATEVVASARPGNMSGSSEFYNPEAVSRTKAIPGVENVAVAWSIPRAVRGDVSSSFLSATRSSERQEVQALSAQGWDVVRPSVGRGRLYGAADERSGARLLVIGRAALQSLGLEAIPVGSTIYVGSHRFLFAAVLDNVERHPELLNQVIIPAETAKNVWGSPGQFEVEGKFWVGVRPGAAPQVASDLAVALDPVAPARFNVTGPPDPSTLRESIGGDMNVIFLILAVICLAMGVFSIATVAVVTLLERISEIGLRRALGAGRVEIALQFLLEAVILGVLGGILGTVIGLVVTIGVTVSQGWTLVWSPSLFVIGPGIGLLTGAVSGVVPSWRASRIEVVEALHSTM